MSTDSIDRVVDEKRHLVTLVLDHQAKANALTAGMMAQLTDDIRGVEPDVRAIVITGRGHRFSGGIDLGDRSKLAQAGETGAATVQDHLDALGQAIRGCPVPVVALINGVCVGGAVELSATCDLRVALDTARFKVPATRIGIIYRPAGWDALLRRLGPAAVRRLVLLGMELSADEALANGLIDATAGSLDEAMERVDALVEGLAGPTFALQKAALDTALASRALEPHQVQAIQEIRDRSTATR
jgi:enoyl-CoA hydratase/carnithine racemase